jgi:dihydropteroate synthase
MTREQFRTWLADENRRPLVMGVLNVTPDSFSDGGKFAQVEAAVAHGRAMLAGGADLIDVGGESTRPGSARVGFDEQIRRVAPVVEALTRGDDCVISIDTTLSRVAEIALDAGAFMINDISGGSDDPAILGLAAVLNAPIVLMQMKGLPATMQDARTYGKVV